jgi:hypothetical protein
VAARRTFPALDEFVVARWAVVIATDELSLIVKNVLPGDVTETGNSATTKEKTLSDIANAPIRTKRRDRDRGATPEGR